MLNPQTIKYKDKMSIGYMSQDGLNEHYQKIGKRSTTKMLTKNISSVISNKK